MKEIGVTLSVVESRVSQIHFVGGGASAGGAGGAAAGQLGEEEIRNEDGGCKYGRCDCASGCAAVCVGFADAP